MSTEILQNAESLQNAEPLQTFQTAIKFYSYPGSEHPVDLIIKKSIDEYNQKKKEFRKMLDSLRNVMEESIAKEKVKYIQDFDMGVAFNLKQSFNEDMETASAIQDDFQREITTRGITVTYEKERNQLFEEHSKYTLSSVLRITVEHKRREDQIFTGFWDYGLEMYNRMKEDLRKYVDSNRIEEYIPHYHWMQHM